MGSPPGEVRPQRVSLEKRTIPWGRLFTIDVPMKANRKPRKMLAEPKVTISVGNRQNAMKNPLNRPSSAPTEPASRKATAAEPWKSAANRSRLVTYMLNAPTAANDTSIPPEMRTISTPSANSPITVPLLHRSKRLSRLKKAGLTSPMPSASNTITTAK